MADLLNERDLKFLLYEFLDTASLVERERYREHSREVFDAVLQTARAIAENRFAPHNAKGDAEEPEYDGAGVRMIPETRAAWDAFAEAGFLSAHWDAGEGGWQLPEVLLRAAMAYFNSANAATAAYPFLTIGAANLLRAFGAPEQKAVWLAAMGDGRCAGTMALTEPGQGSALADIKTHAVEAADGSYRIFGQKMFISGGDQCLTGNIAHMTLARVKGDAPGVKGISMFLVPKRLLDPDGSPGEANDVALAGLLHKMGWRNTTSTVLSFGEKDGAVGYLIGKRGQGLAHMFQMMNEARIGIGLFAACIAYRGFLLALEYARERLQGRLPSCKDPLSPQVPLVAHADIRRLLLAQKAVAEGALALCLYASSLVEDRHTHPDPASRQRAGFLLDFLTPIVKSWPSKHGCQANEMAMQVLGGAGYTRDCLLEQLYRDQRLNPIHEGAEGIHGLDLLGRKAGMLGGACYAAFRAAVGETLAESWPGDPPAGVAGLQAALAASLTRLDEVTACLLDLQQRDPDRALANASVYLDAAGRVVAAWIWLRQALAAARALAAGAGPDADFYRGKLQAARYYGEWELPIVDHQFDLLSGFNPIPLDMRDAWF